MHIYCIQFFDYEEGSAAMWHEVRNSRFDYFDSAREYLRILRAKANEDESLCKFRLVVVDSPEYYSQPFDKGEY
jgi:hypothetical protein